MTEAPPSTLRPVAGVELGGTKCVCVLGSGPDDLREQVRIATTTPEETLGAAVEVIARWRRDHDIGAVGVASFGPLDLDPDRPERGRIVSTPKPGWSGADLSVLTEGLPGLVDTDVNGAAFAEGRWGAARGLRSWAYITVGTGVGAGLVVDGRSITGLGHAEAGHLRVGRVPGDAWPGGCPYHGDCVEGLAGGPAIARAAGRPAEQLSPDDPAWDRVVGGLAGLCHNLVLTTAPERILIGGGVLTGQPWLFPRLRTALIDSLAGYAAGARIAQTIDAYLQPPGLGDRAGPLGAIVLGQMALERAS